MPTHHWPNTTGSDLQNFTLPIREFLGTYNEFLFGFSLLGFVGSLSVFINPALEITPPKTPSIPPTSELVTKYLLSGKMNARVTFSSKRTLLLALRGPWPRLAKTRHFLDTFLLRSGAKKIWSMLSYSSEFCVVFRSLQNWAIWLGWGFYFWNLTSFTFLSGNRSCLVKDF